MNIQPGSDRYSPGCTTSPSGLAGADGTDKRLERTEKAKLHGNRGHLTYQSNTKRLLRLLELSGY